MLFIHLFLFRLFHVIGNVGYVFTNKDLSNKKEKAPVKAGAIVDGYVEAQNTRQVPEIQILPGFSYANQNKPIYHRNFEWRLIKSLWWVDILLQLPIRSWWSALISTSVNLVARKKLSTHILFNCRLKSEFFIS